MSVLDLKLQRLMKDIIVSLLVNFLAMHWREYDVMKLHIQVRHGQGIHNVEGDKNYKTYMNPDYFDAHLTPLGWQQVILLSTILFSSKNPLHFRTFHIIPDWIAHLRKTTVVLCCAAQVDNLRKHVRVCGLSKKIELVITSPLLRYCCQCLCAFWLIYDFFRMLELIVILLLLAVDSVLWSVSWGKSVHHWIRIVMLIISLKRST